MWNHIRKEKGCDEGKEERKRGGERVRERGGWERRWGEESERMKEN